MDSLQAMGLDVTIRQDLDLLSIYHPQGSFDKQTDVGNHNIVLQQNMGNSTHYLITV
jgi:hypothetical protein